MKEIIRNFILESSELIEKLDQDLVTLENSPTDLELLNQIFRSTHTIKGTSSLLGFTNMTELTHDMENVLNKLRTAQLKINPEIMDVLLESLDYVKILWKQIKNGIEADVDLSGIRTKLQKIDQGGIAIPGQEKLAKKIAPKNQIQGGQITKATAAPSE